MDPHIWPSKSGTTSPNIQLLCENTGCSSEDLSEAMNDREKWRERIRDIRAGGMTWKWWCFYNLTPCFFVLWNSGLWFLFFEWSAGQVISAFGVNTGSSCLDLKKHIVGRCLVPLRFYLLPGKVKRRAVEWATRWH